ncbi:MAG: hypothetical protein J6V99_07605 [Neisseriaceae bacterium]|nr:hypothetical protein [Neisseriaceae bacterium]
MGNTLAWEMHSGCLKNRQAEYLITLHGKYPCMGNAPAWEMLSGCLKTGRLNI